MEVVVEGSKCASDGKAKVTINAKAGEGSNLDISKTTYAISVSGTLLQLTEGANTTYLAPGNYTVYANSILCNGIPVTKIDHAQFNVSLELSITKAEYRRCSASDVSVTATVLGGTGPYTYDLLDENNNVVSTKDNAGKDVNLSAKTSSSDLTIRVKDMGCLKNTVVSKNLEATFKIEPSIIEGNKTVCKNENVNLSVKSAYSGHSFQWKKGNEVKSEKPELQIPNATEDDAGDYTFSMILDGCNEPYTETVTINVGAPPVPNTQPAYLCLNSGEVSLSNYVSVTSGTYTLVWYKDNASLIGVTAPTVNPNLPRTITYLVSQKNSTGCESLKAKLTVTVEDLPAKTSENNIILCTSNDSKPKIRVVNAGNYTYNLYTSFSGGTNIGSGKAVNDTAVIETTQDLVVGNTYFLETQNEYGCLSPTRTTVLISIKDSWILGSNKICFGDNLSLSADYAGGKIVWTKPDKSTYTGDKLSINDIKFENAGTYSLLIEESGLGCTIKDKIQVTVTQPAPPTVAADSYRYFQNEAASVMTATPKSGFTLNWYDPEDKPLSGQSPKPATDKIGVFDYSVSQDSLGCESPKVTVKVVVGEIPSSVPASDINICIADKPVIKISNTIQDYKYAVYYKNEVIAEEKGNGGAISLTSKISISENAELGVTVFDIYNISSERTKVNLISVNNLIDLQNSTPSVCDGSTGKLTAVDITGAEYVWTTLNGTVAEKSVTVNNASNADAGTYVLAVTTPGCPVAKQSIELKVEKPAKPSTATELFYCTGDADAKLTATALPGYKLVWFDESQTQLADAPAPNTSVAETSTYYVLQRSISDENCLSDMEKITVVVEDKPDAAVLDPVNVCSIPGNPQPVSVRIPTSSEGYIYSLYSQETGGALAGYAASTGDDLPVDITIKDSEINSGQIYYLEVTNKAGCMSDRTPVEVIITEITLTPDELPSYQINEFYSQILKTNAPNPQYAIIKGYLPIGFTVSTTGDISGVASAYAEPSIFTVEVTSSLGCAVQKEYTLKSELLVSKMFSPNGDGINDIFMRGYRVIIFDRLGRKLHSGDDGWDGTYNGKVMPEDVYYYILYYKDKDGREQRVTSYVTLIKTM